MFRVAIICLSLLAACGYSRSDDGRIIIKDDNGGSIEEYEKTRAKLASDPVGVALCGNIQSAATIYVSLPNACSCPDALFSFHGATRMFRYSPEGTAIMTSYYPEPLKSWYLREAAHLMYTDHATLTARKLDTMNVLEICQ
jgi:uncharacterized Fe-S cluster-containing protein